MTVIPKWFYETLVIKVKAHNQEFTHTITYAFLKHFTA